MLTVYLTLSRVFDWFQRNHSETAAVPPQLPATARSLREWHGVHLGDMKYYGGLATHRGALRHSVGGSVASREATIALCTVPVRLPAAAETLSGARVDGSRAAHARPLWRPRVHSRVAAVPAVVGSVNLVSHYFRCPLCWSVLDSFYFVATPRACPATHPYHV